MPGHGNKILEDIKLKIGNDPLMTFDLEKKNTLHISCNINAYTSAINFLRTRPCFKTHLFVNKIY